MLPRAHGRSGNEHLGAGDDLDAERVRLALSELASPKRAG
jgi:hypothetical protein